MENRNNFLERKRHRSLITYQNRKNYEADYFRRDEDTGLFPRRFNFEFDIYQSCQLCDWRHRFCNSGVRNWFARPKDDFQIGESIRDRDKRMFGSFFQKTPSSCVMNNVANLACKANYKQDPNLYVRVPSGGSYGVPLYNWINRNATRCEKSPLQFRFIYALVKKFYGPPMKSLRRHSLDLPDGIGITALDSGASSPGFTDDLSNWSGIPDLDVDYAIEVMTRNARGYDSQEDIPNY